MARTSTKSDTLARRDGDASPAIRTTASVVKTEEKPGRTLPPPAWMRGLTYKEAPGLSPTVDWRPLTEKPDQCVVGRYLETREDIGPYGSSLHQLVDVETGEIVGVWGGAILDRKVTSVDPEKHCLLVIQYIADVPVKGRGKPARDFRVAVIQE